MSKRIEQLSELRKAFIAFRRECEWCRNVYNTHCALFNSDDETDQALRHVAGWFFYDLSKITQEYHVLVVGRLTDPARTSGNVNLSVPLLLSRLDEVGRLSDEIKAVAENLMLYGGKIKNSRSKLVAHRDYKTIIKKIRYGDHTHGEVASFHSDLNKFCDLVAIALGGRPLDFSTQAGTGDVFDLLHFLRRAKIFDE